MEAGRRRGVGRGRVPAGSVWESRMKLDAVNGGVKVFSDADGDAAASDDGVLVARPKPTAGGGPERRKRWQPDAEKVPLHIRKSRSNAAGAARLRPSKSLDDVGGGKEGDEADDADADDDDEVEEEMEMEMVDVKEMDANSEGSQILVQEQETQKQASSITSIEKKMDSNDPKSDNAAEEERPLPPSPISKKPANVAVKEKTRVSPLKKPTRPATEKKTPMPPPNKIEHPAVDPDLPKPPSSLSAEVPISYISETQNRFQNFVDLVMWRDISRTALVFGFGTFMLISSSYTKEIHFSFTSAVSYFCLIYLAVRFMHRAFLLRGSTDIKENYVGYMVSEGEAVRLVKVVLPYFNELLLTLRSLFSGDPATTLKLSVVLFVLARCGGSITMWTMAKLAFFGVFTLPKMYQAYSSQMAAYVRIWLRRLQDAWDSCTHKKLVAAVIFTVVWNLSSVVARLWAVFMLVASVKLYQQSSHQNAWNQAEHRKDGDSGRRPEIGRTKVTHHHKSGKREKGCVNFMHRSPTHP